MNFLKTVTATSAKLITKIKVKSPEILIGVGITSIGVGFALTIRNSLIVKEKIEEKNAEIEEFKDSHDETDETYAKDLTKLYFSKGLVIIRNYAAPIAFTAGGVLAILGSYGIMARRQAALISAYGALDEAFKKYRERVKEKYGEETERELYLGEKKEKKLTAIEEKEDGTEEKVEVKNGAVITDPSQISQYARFFDESSDFWQKSSEYNKMFLIQMQNQANDKLKARGHLFLNEVYDMLGFEHTQAGSVVGWLMGAGDDFVDFGIYDIYTEPRRSAFINGYERSILLDFNVDGVIFDKI